MSKAENLIEAFELINATIPSVAAIIVKLKNGSEMNLKELTEETEDIVERKLKEAVEHLTK